MRKTFLACLICLLAEEADASERPEPRPEAMRSSGLVPEPRPQATGEPAPEPRRETTGEPSPELAAGGEALCGDATIRGARLDRVDDPGACGIARPVRVEAIAGVALEPPAVLACRTARRLRDWLERSAKPVFGAGGEELVGLGIAAGYVCRNVNYAEDGEVSEHGLGRAVDIARFELAGGATVSVLEDWGGEAHGDRLAEIQGAACGLFGTALGPESDEYHADHFHFDVADRRRSYCPGISSEPSGP